MHRKLARALSLVALVLTAVLVAGCGILTSPYEPQDNKGRGQTAESVVARIKDVPGVEDAQFHYDDWYQDGEGGLFSSSGMNFTLDVTIADGHYIEKPTALLWYLAKEAWTANEKSPKGSLGITITGGISDNYMWEKSIIAVFGSMQAGASYTHREDYTYEEESEDADQVVTDGYLPVYIGISDDAMNEVFGDWPGDITSYDASDAISDGDIPIITPGAVTDTSLTWVGLGNEYYVKYVGARNTVDTEVYEGDFTVIFYYDGKEVGTSTQTYADSYAAYDDEEETPTHFSADLEVGNKSPDLSHYTYSVEFESQDGFDTGDINGN